MRTTSRWLCGMAVGAACLGAAAAPVEVVKPAIDRAVEGFAPGEVRLLDGPFRRAQEKDHAYLLRLEPDRLLSWFRKEAGLPPKAQVYGGWEERGVAGHSLGHYLSACAWMFRVTDDPRLKERVDYTVQELAACQEANGNGYLAAIPRGKEVFAEIARGDIRSQGFDLNGCWVPWYTEHKVLAGLRDAYTLAGNEQARSVMLRLCDWAIETTRSLDDAQWQRMLACEHGGMNEVLADAYAVTGDRKYLELALKFRHRAVLDPLAARRDELDGKHANTQIPKLIGAARIHSLTGDPEFGVMSDFFWRTVVAQHSYVTGGNSLGEHFGPPGRLNDRLGDNTTETCNTYNMLRLTKALIERQPRPELGDYAERALWNHILASQNPDDGMVCYFVPLKSGSEKRFMRPFDDFTCCTGTGMENHARYPELIYYRSAKALVVDQYISSTVSWPEREFHLRQLSDLPRSGRVAFSIGCDRPLELTLRLRHPHWATGKVRVEVNGKRRSVTSRPGGYLSLVDTWHDGDVVTVDWPLALRTEAMPDNPARIAIFWGPVLLAGDLGPGPGDPSVPVLVTGGRPVSAWVRRVDPDGLEFATRKVGRPTDVMLSPFHAFHGRRHAVYWDVYTQAGWKEREAAQRAEEARQRALEARTVDVLRIGEMQPERDHDLQGERTSAGEAFGRKWRHATDGGWFDFKFKCDPNRPVDLVVTYWGSDAGGNREFDILVQGTKVATQRLERNQPDAFFDVTYPLPATLTQGQERIAVRFQAHPGKWAGGVFGVRLLRRDVTRP